MARPSTAAVVYWNGRLAVFAGSSVYVATAAAGVSCTSLLLFAVFMRFFV